MKVSRVGRPVVTVSGKAAARVAALLETAGPARRQLLARATGTYRRGNERR